MNKIKYIPIFFIFLVSMVVFFASLVVKLKSANLTIIITGISLLIAFILLKIFFLLNKKVRFIHIMNILLNIVFVCFIILFIFVEYNIIAKSNLKEVNRSDFIIVLGAQLYGEEPSFDLVKRLDASLIVLNGSPDAKIILSGGQGPGENITEAEAMKRYLVSRGVNGDNIFEEDRATNTYENIMFSKEIMDGFYVNNPSVTVVTNDSHMYRALYICNKLGVKAYGYTCPVYPTHEKIMYLREFFAVVKTYVFN